MRKVIAFAAACLIASPFAFAESAQSNDVLKTIPGGKETVVADASSTEGKTVATSEKKKHHHAAAKKHHCSKCHHKAKTMKKETSKKAEKSA